MSEIYDVIIIGAGPAGMSAALYTSRANINTLIIERDCPGGKMMKTKKIENYLGSSSVDAVDLASSMFSQATQFGAKYKQGNVVSIEDNKEFKTILLSSGEQLKCKALIIAVGGKITGSNFKYDSYLNKGLSYCVVCDAAFYKGKTVAIIAGEKDIDEVKYLVNIASKVYFLNKSNIKLENDKVINIPLTNDNYEILGINKVEGFKVDGKQYDIDGLFYVDDENSFNGISSILELDNGYIKVDNNMHTSIDGIYACGDITNRKIKQVISAAGDGASAALEAIKYVNTGKNQ